MPLLPHLTPSSITAVPELARQTLYSILALDAPLGTGDTQLPATASKPKAFCFLYHNSSMASRVRGLGVGLPYTPK